MTSSGLNGLNLQSPGRTEPPQQTVSTVKKSHATITSACARRNCVQMGPWASWCWTEAVSAQQGPDGRGRPAAKQAPAWTRP